MIERVGQRYKIWFKWVGSDDHTWRWWSEIRKELTEDNPLLQEISAAVSAERDRYNAAYGNHDEFDEQLQPTAAPETSHNDIATPEVEEDHTIDDGLTIAQRRRPRKAHTTQGHMAAITYLQAWAYSKLCAAKAVVEDDFTLPDTWPSMVPSGQG